MKLALIGASGHIGRAVAHEALSRGHEITAIARVASRIAGLDGASVASADVLDPGSITDLLVGHDAVVLSIKGRSDDDSGTVPAAARVLLDVLPRAGVRRLLFVGGGGSLEVAPGVRFVDTPQFPDQYRAEALAQAEALATLRASGGAVEWSYASPPPVHLLDGGRRGAYRIHAGDHPVMDEHGESRITVADFASALIDTLENGAFIRQRFTAAY